MTSEIVLLQKTLTDQATAYKNKRLKTWLFTLLKTSMDYNKNKRTAIAILDSLMRGLRLKHTLFDFLKNNYSREKKLKRIVLKRIKKLNAEEKSFGLQTLLKNFSDVQNQLKTAFDFQLYLQSSQLRSILHSWTLQVKKTRIFHLKTLRIRSIQSY